MATVTLGLDCKLYIGTAGTQAATLVANVRDVKLDLEYEEADATSRESGGWEEVVTTIKKGSVEFQMLYKPADANFTSIRTAWLNNTPISALVMDGLKTVTGKQGFDADFTVSKFSQTQPLKEGTVVDVALKPTPSTRAPAWFTAP